MHARAVAKQLVVQQLELGLVVGQAGIVGRLRPRHHCAFLHQLVDSPQNRQRHVLAVWIEAEQAIVHAAAVVMRPSAAFSSWISASAFT